MNILNVVLSVAQDKEEKKYTEADMIWFGKYAKSYVSGPNVEKAFKRYKRFRKHPNDFWFQNSPPKLIIKQ